MKIRATGGTFRLSFNGQTTGPLAYDASAGDGRNGAQRPLEHQLRGRLRQRHRRPRRPDRLQPICRRPSTAGRSRNRTCSSASGRPGWRCLREPSSAARSPETSSGRRGSSTSGWRTATRSPAPRRPPSPPAPLRRARPCSVGRGRRSRTATRPWAHPALQDRGRQQPDRAAAGTVHRARAHVDGPPQSQRIERRDAHLQRDEQLVRKPGKLHLPLVPQRHRNRLARPRPRHLEHVLADRGRQRRKRRPSSARSRRQRRRLVGVLQRPAQSDPAIAAYYVPITRIDIPRRSPRRSSPDQRRPAVRDLRGQPALDRRLQGRRRRLRLRRVQRAAQPRRRQLAGRQRSRLRARRTQFPGPEVQRGGQPILAFGKEVNESTDGDVCTAASGDACGRGTCRRRTKPRARSALHPVLVRRPRQSARRLGNQLAVDKAGHVYLGGTEDERTTTRSRTSPARSKPAGRGSRNGTPTGTLNSIAKLKTHYSEDRVGEGTSALQAGLDRRRLERNRLRDPRILPRRGRAGIPRANSPRPAAKRTPSATSSCR